MCTVKEAQDRQLEWMGMHEDDKVGKRENDEKRWWTKMLQQANATMGMSYPRTGTSFS